MNCLPPAQRMFVPHMVVIVDMVVMGEMEDMLVCRKIGGRKKKYKKGGGEKSKVKGAVFCVHFMLDLGG